MDPPPPPPLLCRDRDRDRSERLLERSLWWREERCDLERREWVVGAPEMTEAASSRKPIATDGLADYRVGCAIFRGRDRGSCVRMQVKGLTGSGLAEKEEEDSEVWIQDAIRGARTAMEAYGWR